MRRCRAAELALLLLVVPGFARAGAAPAAPPDSTAAAPTPTPPAAPPASHAPASAGLRRVVYLAGATVYVDGGTSEGLREGDTLSVRRGRDEIARLRVSVLSTHRAACDTLFTNDVLRTGDAVIRLGQPPPPAPVASSSPAPAWPTLPATSAAAAAPSGARSRPWLRGRVGARWLSVRAEGGVRFDRPMLDLRLDGGDDGSPTAVGLDLRGRRTVRTAASGGEAVDGEARVYRAAFSMRGNGGREAFSVGRLASPSLGSVSLFDGALLETRGERWNTGVFGGTQPEPIHMGWSGEISEYGGFVETHQRGSPERMWRAGLGAVSSYDHGQSNRDFLFGQAFWRDRRFTGSLLQEADVVRNWKRLPGEPGLSLSSTFATLSSQVRPWLTLQTGYDNRHNVRLWRDRVTPETEFDDSYRQGAWGGASVRLPQGFTFSGDQRWNHGGVDNSSVTDLTGDWFHPAWRSLSIRGRWSAYNSDPSRSRLLSGSLGANPVGVFRLEVTGGRRETLAPATGDREVVLWWGADSDLMLGRRWFLDASFESSKGQLDHTTQFYGGISRRL
jgi:hypothetical protein